MNEESDVLMLGLPGTGKSTFLAALWGSIKNENTACALALSNLGEEREYLEGLWRKWVRAEELEKTPSESAHAVELELEDRRRDPARRLTLKIPDLSGETFREQFESRQWTIEFETKCAHAERVALFAHAERMVEGTTLADVQHARLGVGDGSGTDPGAAASEQSVQKWKPSSCRTQVQLVELLQYLTHHAPLDRPRRLAVVASAWDLLDGGASMTPNAWLRGKMGLLAQYLDANPDHYRWDVFGVSAQGFAYRSEEDRGARLGRYENEWDRVRVVRGDSVEERHDVTEPIQWLLDE